MCCTGVHKFIIYEAVPLLHQQDVSLSKLTLVLVGQTLIGGHSLNKPDCMYEEFLMVWECVNSNNYSKSWSYFTSTIRGIWVMQGILGSRFWEQHL
jgi:hypothetical protein